MEGRSGRRNASVPVKAEKGAAATGSAPRGATAASRTAVSSAAGTARGGTKTGSGTGASNAGSVSRAPRARPRGVDSSAAAAKVKSTASAAGGGAKTVKSFDAYDAEAAGQQRIGMGTGSRLQRWFASWKVWINRIWCSLQKPSHASSASHARVTVLLASVLLLVGAILLLVFKFSSAPPSIHDVLAGMHMSSQDQNEVGAVQPSLAAYLDASGAAGRKVSDLERLGSQQPVEGSAGVIDAQAEPNEQANGHVGDEDSKQSGVVEERLQDGEQNKNADPEVERESVGEKSARLLAENPAVSEPKDPPVSFSVTLGTDSRHLSRFEMWEGRDESTLKSPVCRINNVYIDTSKATSSTVMLPKSLKEIIEKHASDCGFTFDYAFYDEATQGAILPADQETYDYVNPLEKNIEFHMPHFVRQFLTQDYTSIGTLWDTEGYQTGVYKYMCTDAKGESCEPLSPDQYRIAYMIPPREKTQYWVRAFLRSLSPLLRILYQPEPDVYFRSSSPQYFRSIVVSKQQKPPVQLRSKHPIYSNNGVVFRDRLPACDGSRPLRVMIQDRISNHSRHIGYGRHFNNIENIVASLESTGKQRGMEVQVSVEYFEGKTFEYQVRKFAEPDVAIVAHGAGATNLIFAQRSGLILEVLPFSHSIDLFERFAHLLDVNYLFTIAPLDVASLRECLMYNNVERRAKELTELTRKSAIASVESFIKRLEVFMAEYNATDFAHYTGPKLLKIHEAWNLHTEKEHVPNFHTMCLRHQDFTVDADRLADAVLSFAETKCTSGPGQALHEAAVQTFRHPDLAGPICRLTNVFLEEDKSGKTWLLVQEGLKKVVTEEMQLQCGITYPVKYFTVEKQEALLSMEDLAHSVDLIAPVGTAATAKAAHFFARDFLYRDYTLFGALMEDTALSGFTMGCEMSSEAADAGLPCKAPSAATLRPKYRLSDKAKVAPWILSMLNSMSPRMRFMYTETPDPRKKVFFQSIVFSKNQPNIPASLRTHHPLLRALKDKYGQDAFSLLPQCAKRPFRVVIMNRISDHSKGTGYGRSFVGVDALTAALRGGAATNGKYSVEVSVLDDVEKMSFEQQRAAFYAADVVITSHSEFNGNLIFMKQGALMVEVLPFAHVINLFQKMARSMHISYMFWISNPDDESLQKCLMYQNVRSHMSEKEAQAAADKVTGFMRIVHEQGEAFSTAESSLRFGAAPTAMNEVWNMHEKTDHGLAGASGCFRSQEIRFDVKALSAEVHKHLAAFC
ncbi:hypothetical protein FVE85_0725 [Porphyridium purpureum]|uniref:Glycosyltransferase 61 catalytic domain-containing protein n=1 Tax=Porphyridium purpureum TaxID=35688 RepID=A0A5J4Z053_PORPP|nr:hypothetical protein FVE85_0725 [Porphyridium purpureum]|eukprot:POR7459..scf208_2